MAIAVRVPVEVSANDTYGRALGAASRSPAAVIDERVVMFFLHFLLSTPQFLP
jgi:hypothetical protein